MDVIFHAQQTNDKPQQHYLMAVKTQHIFYHYNYRAYKHIICISTNKKYFIKMKHKSFYSAGQIFINEVVWNSLLASVNFIRQGSFYTAHMKKAETSWFTLSLTGFLGNNFKV
jgi:hypothetical protein